MKINGVGFSSLLFLLFLALKLTNYITWSWWWVTAPLWVPLVIFLLVLAAIAVIGVLAAVITK
jgi:hypothetical protein